MLQPLLKPEIDSALKVSYNICTKYEQELIFMTIIQDRRALHQIPELDRNLPKTLAYLQEALKDLMAFWKPNGFKPC